MGIRIWIFFIGLLICNADAGGKTPDFVIEAIPSWVEIINDEELSAIPDQETAHGVHYRLIDKQIKKEKDVICYFTHISKRIINQNGIDNAAQLEIEFDPLCDSIFLHHVNVKRGKEVISHLSSAKIKVLQGEKELEQKMYSGIKSIAIILDDIRVGDIVDYSFTIKDSNQNINKSFYKKIYLSSPVPIHFLRQRILWPQNRPLSIKNYSETLKPEIKQQQNYTEYLWKKKNLPLDNSEPGKPVWYDADPWVEVSEKQNWHEINLLLSSRYKVCEDLSPSLQKHVDSIAHTTKDAGERFISLMRFIQDEVRYMGMLDRIDGGFQPVDPATVFSRRFGDCKDKTFLAITMLEALGIEAYPAVVHTVYGENLNVRLPNSAIFNHIIVVAVIDGRKYWIDPTVPFQGGTLDDFVQPDYGYALILDGKSNNLTKMPLLKPTQPTVEIYETYDMSKGPENPGYLTVKSLFKHRHADIQRESLLVTPKKELRDRYIKTYQKYHPSIREKKDLVIIDDRRKNIITLVEEYEIPDQWVREEANKKWFVRSYADEFTDYLSSDDITADRKAPLSLLFPRHISKKTEMILPEKEWDLNPEVITINDPAFEFKREEKVKGSTFSISYTYKSLKGHIEPQFLDSYLKNIKQASDILGVTIQQFDEVPANQTLNKKDTLNWPILMLVIIVFCICVLLAFKIYAYQPKAPIIPGNPKLRGIKGWLFIPAIGLLLTPFRLIKDCWETASLIFSHNAWLEISSSDSDSFHSLLAPFLLIETIGNIAFFICSILILGLLFMKKKFFPRLYIYFLAGNFLWIVLDQVVAIFVFSQALTRSEGAELARAGLGALIWCTYMMKSKRVKATFVE